MLGLLAAALLAPTPSPAPASPPAESATALETAHPWWERITVTVDGQGTQQSCRYETSASPAGAEACDEAVAASIKTGGGGTAGLFKQVTFERRFSPGARLDAGKLSPGDTLLGRQVMYLTFDPRGAISGCRIVSSAGDVPPDYGCAEARKEQFKAPAAADAATRQAFLTVLAYGHTESIA